MPQHSAHRRALCARSTLRTLRDETRGVVIVEFLIAFVPLLLLFLGIVQLTLLSAARMVVQHAAVAGARSASVVLDDDPARYGGEQPMVLSSGRRDGVSAVRATALTRALLGGAAGDAGFDASSGADGPRMAAIRLAAYARLVAIVPSGALQRLLFPGLVERSVGAALGDADVLRWLESALYLPAAASVTLPKQPGSRELWRERVAAEAAVSVRVTYLAPCLVPVVSRLMCHSLGYSLLDGELNLPSGASDTQRAAVRELRHAPNASQQVLFFVHRVRVAVLQAEATLPLQRARYRYASELEGEPEREPS